MYLAFLISKNVLELFKALNGHLIPYLSLLIFLMSFLLTLTAVTALGNCVIKQLWLIVNNRHCQEKDYLKCERSESCQKKTSLETSISKELPDRSKNDSSLRKGFLGSQTHCALLGIGKLLGFTVFGTDLSLQDFWEFCRGEWDRAN